MKPEVGIIEDYIIMKLRDEENTGLAPTPPMLVDSSESLEIARN